MQGRKSLFAAPVESSDGAAEHAAGSAMTPVAARPTRPALRAVIVKVCPPRCVAAAGTTGPDAIHVTECVGPHRPRIRLLHASVTNARAVGDCSFERGVTRAGVGVTVRLRQED